MTQLAEEAPIAPTPTPYVLAHVARHLREHCASDISLDDLSQQTGYSAGHLIRAFKQHYGLTPHAYLINQRIQLGQAALRQGQPIVEVALTAGFNDQPHFQRTFRRLVAATPNQYRPRSSKSKNRALPAKPTARQRLIVRRTAGRCM
ncbi:AraC family transcriptional regulator [Vreelandella lionensis]|uniref:AraC family transcriptional regulator n=1 Tax=Vreelandella lionensis TaxID=1144478 RepID=UPI0030F38EE4